MNLFPWIFATLALVAAPAAAQTVTESNRSFVSGVGKDAGKCRRASPCRTFAFAIGVTRAGGEIVALDPAGYGPVTIDKSISIIGPGTGLAQISAGSGDGVSVNAGSGDTVTLRGVEIDGGNAGVNLGGFGALVVRDSVIRGATYGVISFSGGLVTVVDSTIANAGSIGVFLSGANLSLRNSLVSGAGDVGVSVSGRTEVVDSTFVNPSGTALSVGGFAFVKGSVFVGNNIGIALASNATAQLDTTTLTGNGTGVSQINNNSAVQSYGNNHIVGNGTDVSGTPVTTVSTN